MLWDDIRARDAELSTRPPTQARNRTADTEPLGENDIPQAVLERAAIKARAGAVRAAANLLTGLPPVQLSQELSQAVAKLSHTTRRTPS